jgi:hypothetical protein
MLKRFVVLAMVAGLGLAAGGARTTAWSIQTTAPGWERYFTVTFETVERHGHPLLRGEVTNQFGMMAERIQLLVEGLDPSGQVVSQRVVWLGRPIGAFGRSYFDTPAEKAASYRVGIYAFTWGQNDMK